MRPLPESNKEIKELRKVIREACESIIGICDKPRTAIVEDPDIIKPLISISIMASSLADRLEVSLGAVGEALSLVEKMIAEFNEGLGKLSELEDGESLEDNLGGTMVRFMELLSAMQVDGKKKTGQLEYLKVLLAKVKAREKGEEKAKEAAISRFEKIRQNNSGLGDIQKLL